MAVPKYQDADVSGCGQEAEIDTDKSQEMLLAAEPPTLSTTVTDPHIARSPA